MSVARWAIVLEFISFFLVTIDLLGEERIRLTQGRLQRGTRWIRNIDVRFEAGRFLSWADKPRPYGRIKLNIASFLITLVVLYPLLRILGIPRKTQLEQYLFYVLFAFLVPFALLGVLLILVALEFLIDAMLQGALFLLVRLHLQNVMLYVGAILFIISKSMSLMTTP